jgi:hypothetical protein
LSYDWCSTRFSVPFLHCSQSGGVVLSSEEDLGSGGVDSAGIGNALSGNFAGDNETSRLAVERLVKAVQSGKLQALFAGVIIGGGHWQKNTNGSAMILRVIAAFNPNLTSVAFDKLLRDKQSNARSHGTAGCEEGVEHLR